MKQSTRIKQLFQIPSYRTRLALFLTIGGLLLSISLLAPIDPRWQNLGTNVATTFVGVGLVSYLWDFLGGDPIEVKIAQGFDELRQTTKVLSDMSENNLGIERIWSARKDWESDKSDGLEMWKKRICQAKHVDIISNTFRAWTYDNNFWDEFLESIKRGTKFRLLIYDPNSDILKIRSKNEDDPESKKISEMKLEIGKTLDRMKEKFSHLDKNARNNFEIRLNAEYYQMAQIIRADKRILVALYRPDKSGSYSPTLQILGPDSSWFKVYTEQFEPLWEVGKPFVSRLPKVSSK